MRLAKSMTDEVDSVDRYLRIVRWAERRYAVQHRLVLRIGDRLSRYSRIERAAFVRYVLPHSRRAQ